VAFNVEKTILYAKVTGAAVGVLLLLYLVYKIFSGIAEVAGKLTADTPASVPDSQGNYSGGLVEKAINNSATIGKSSLSYTDAFTQSVLHPWESAKSILGLN
jgi:hypothetical protein